MTWFSSTEWRINFRMLATPGESLRINHGIVCRNGVAPKEPYIIEATAYDPEIKNYQIFVDGSPLDFREADIPPRTERTLANTVPRGCDVMLGDNRNNSEDSPSGGCAQSGGTFFGGPEAGHAAGTMEHAVQIIWPQDRRRDLP